jgi:hypothetical protein
VKRAISKRATLLGSEIAKGVGRPHAARRDDLFAVAGWETQIGRDFESSQYLGYCALTNAGYSAENPPADLDLASSSELHQFVGELIIASLFRRPRLQTVFARRRHVVVDVPACAAGQSRRLTLRPSILHHPPWHFATAVFPASAPIHSPAFRRMAVRIKQTWQSPGLERG